MAEDPDQSSRRLPSEGRVAHPVALAIFGATGDLTRRKLVPALFSMAGRGLLPDRFAVVGFARRPWDDATFRSEMEAALAEFAPGADAEAVRAFCANLHYVRGDLGQPEDFRALGARLEAVAPGQGRVFYLATAPDLFTPIVEGLASAGLVRPPFEEPWSRVVIEKPFGHDLASARDLSAAVGRHLAESQIYRIDHYLGKETVQNLLSFRFANLIFEPLFNHRYVDHVQITAAEAVGMESGRGAYYDRAGALRDMVQNHLLQLLCFAAMEPPASLDPDAIRNEKVKVLQSVAPWTPETIRRHTVRAQYTGGSVDGRPAPGFREEDRVGPASTTETYVALRLMVNTWRWAGVPFFLRTGKRLARAVTEVAVQFRVPPLQLFETVACEGDVCDLTQAEPNRLVFRIQPDPSIRLTFSAKRPSLQMVVESVGMRFSYQETWDRHLPEAYERLLLDVMRGDATLFTRSDEVEAAWSIADPVLREWSAGRPPMAYYSAGAWGPREADALLAAPHRTWHNPSATRPMSVTGPGAGL